VTQSLTDEEFDRLGDILKQFGSAAAMNLEELDGFFAALICGPDNVLPSEYLPEVWGDDIANRNSPSVQPILVELISLITRHWNTIINTLTSGDVFTPLLLVNEHDFTPANDWAIGFLRGMELRRSDWTPLLDDEQHAGSLVPIFALAHEHDPDPVMRPYDKPIDAESREKLIIGAAAGVMRIYRYFEPHRLAGAQLHGGTETFRRFTGKVGRNDPCPCGSGRKFKYCCATLTFH
jgi:uncharacterized protein